MVKSYKKDYKFILNSHEQIRLKSFTAISAMLHNQGVEATIYGEDFSYIIADEDADELLNSLISLIKKAILNNLKKNFSNKKSLGYLWNQELHKTTLLLNASGQDWQGQRYQLWETPGNVSPKLDTWLYNDNHGNIILEITPTYPWHFSDPEPGETYISYAEFIKNYQPLLIRTIPKETAQKWLNQAKEIFKQLQLNTQKLSPH